MPVVIYQITPITIKSLRVTSHRNCTRCKLLKREEKFANVDTKVCSQCEYQKTGLRRTLPDAPATPRKRGRPRKQTNEIGDNHGDF